MKAKNCGSCFWYLPDAQICVNSLSEHCTDSKAPVDSCSSWEKIDLEHVEFTPAECGYEK